MSAQRAAKSGDSKNPAELLEGSYRLATKREMERFAYLEELREQERAAKRAAVAVTE